ncbi:hypothetical protein AK812_SmicGene28023 [Symbiodinium microadriaticum]|uniref:CCHC-type domain-containing protein n=1 Tax=Symbiodinium microadriaticum TaxID=2951 RepID=A0A1Q9D5C6_SYMMI|nr:hypothetical protein AK812_SmicGene28023 [Symbiodinium microadriaticum]
MSVTTESSSTAVTRTKEGIPSWSGEAGSFVQYEEAALLWEQSLTWEKRYTAGPKLVQELTGAARRYVAGQPAGWVAYRGGVTTLMDHLRKALGKPRVNEVTDLLATYFKGTRRKANESMNEFITRKTEAYMRASQALKRVQPHYDDKHRGPGEAEASTEATTQEPASEAADSWTSYWEQPRNRSWNWNSWGWQSGWGYQPWGAATSSTSGSTSGAYQGTASELLPSFIQGWYLLADANLDHAERNIVLTAIAGDFSPERVGQELRNQFPEGEIRRRDQRRFQSYLGEALDDEEDEDHGAEGNSIPELTASGLDEESIALVVDAEETAREALAAMFQAKRTLKEARQKQHFVKSSRKYFQGGQGKGGASAAKPRDDSNIECLRCGKRGHRAANCAYKPLAAQADASGNSGGDGAQQAPFVCYHDQVIDEHLNGFAISEIEETKHEALSANVEGTGLSTSEAVMKGMCVVDGGATQTVGSVRAVEAVLDQNLRRHGSTRLSSVSTKDPPTFSFGNSTENKCLSTALLRVTAGGTPGELRVHTLDHGQSPILLSIEALRRLGAVIDFEADLIAFRHLNDKKIVRLARGKSGHQLLPLTEDWMANAQILEQWNHATDMFAAILAQNLAFLVPRLVPNTMDKMSKAELTLHLRSVGEEPPKSWGRLELKQRLAEMAELGEVAIATPKKEKTPLQQATTELNRASVRKATLVEHVKENYGLKVGPNDTVAVIQRNCLNHLLTTIEPVDEDTMGFGKHSAKTYLEVMECDAQYAEWARVTAQEASCSVHLRRFVTWLDQRGSKEIKKKVVVTPKKKSVAGGYKKPPTTATSSMSSGSTPVVAMASSMSSGSAPMASSTSSGSGNTEAMHMISQLAEMMGKISQQVQALEEDRMEKPRKIVAKPDQEMEDFEDSR